MLVKNLDIENSIGYALLIEYNGSDLVGWQKQNEGMYVQSSLEEAAKNIFNQPDVDGGLIGGASLSPNDFSGIINSI